MANAWRSADLIKETSWLSEQHPEGATTGYDVSGWEDSTWILHAMYELPGMDVGYTHDDAHKAELASGVASRSHIDELLDDATATGVPLGLMGKPDASWNRLKWADLSDRLRLGLGDNEYPPCFRWFPYRSWPASVQPPPEGSLDQESLSFLTMHLLNYSAECVAAYSLLAAGMDESINRCFLGPVGSVRELVGKEMWFVGTPSNIWAPDSSWLAYTDWDLWGTKVSGPASLIEAIRSDTALETVDWHPTGGLTQV